LPFDYGSFTVWSRPRISGQTAARHTLPVHRLGSGKSVLSCADAIGAVLEKHLTARRKRKIPEKIAIHRRQSRHQDGRLRLVRNIAGNALIAAVLLAYQEGCFVCPNCGYTKCRKGIYVEH